MRVIAFFCLFLLGCNSSDNTQSLSGGWTFASEGKDGKVIVKGALSIPCKVVDYDFNDSFIVARQIPTDYCFILRDSISYPFYQKDKAYYWVIVHKKNLLLGPLSEIDYRSARVKYNVSDDVMIELSN